MIAEGLQHLAQPITNLKPLPGNPRRGNVEAVAKSYEQFGQRKPLVALKDGTVIAGNHQLKAAQQLGWTEIAVVFVDDDEATAKAYALADNRTADLGSYDDEALAELISDIAHDADLLMASGYTAEDLDALIAGIDGVQIDPEVLDSVPDSAPAKTVRGDVWLLGEHRLMCGDSTVPTDVARLMNGKKVLLLHADPPYGMGKEKDGVLNDNLYGNKLDAFQMAWWATFRPYLEDNASAYVWGNPEDLWRLWYVGGLKDSEVIEFSNEITWDKSSAIGMRSALQLTYPIGSERCLVFRLGQQYVGNINSDDFPEEWEPLRSYLHGQAEKVGIKSKTIKEICGVEMYGHWFTKSQFTLIPEKHYLKLQQAHPSAFLREWDELRAEWNRVRGNGRDVINGMLKGMRSYFDNTHDNMTDVWTFSRVHGEERHEHATPKPVEMIARAIKSSAPEKAILAEPFGGSGSTLIAAHQTGRTCYTMELDPHYCDIICKRFQQATGIEPVAESTGNPHNFLTD